MGKEEQEDITLPKLEVPEFEHSIPESLLEKLNQKDRETIIALNVMARKQDWTMEDRKKLQEYLERMERLILKLKWKVETMTSKWAVAGYIGGIVAVAFLTKYVEKLLQ